jgi:cytochrome c oxidase assembly factor CtaG
MAWTSPTTINTTQGLDSFLPYLSEVTNFWFGRMLMVAIFVIFLFGYLRAKSDDFIGALAVSSYVTFVLGLLFWVIGLVSGLDFAIIIGIAVVSSVLLLTQKKDY